MSKNDEKGGVNATKSQLEKDLEKVLAEKDGEAEVRIEWRGFTLAFSEKVVGDFIGGMLGGISFNTVEANHLETDEPPSDVKDHDNDKDLDDGEVDE